MARLGEANIGGRMVPAWLLDLTAEELDGLKWYSRPNLLHNWYFVGGGSQQGGRQFPINQRGETSYLSSGYGIDRWRLASPGETLTLNADGIHISFDSGSNRIFRQLFEKAFIQAGKIYTFSVLIGNVTGDVYISSNIHNTVIGASSSNIKVTANSVTSFTFITKDEIPNTPNVYIWGNGSETDIIAAKLELGPTQTLCYQDEDGNWQLFETPDYGEELAKCQRYLTTIRANNPHRVQSYTANSLRFVVPIPVSMRTGTPSIVDTSALSVKNMDGNAQDGFTFRCWHQNLNGEVLIDAEKANHGLVDGFLQSRSSDTLLSMEL